jgi:hypothetical protein
MRAFFDDNDDPKSPRPIDVPKKREGVLERCEAGMAEDRDYHRHVRTRHAAPRATPRSRGGGQAGAPARLA